MAVRHLVMVVLFGLIPLMGGCGGGDDGAGGEASQEVAGAAAEPGVPATKPRGPVQLRGGTPASPDAAGSTPKTTANLETVLAHMKPLQVLLGRWKGTTSKDGTLVPQQWVWDFQTDPDRPALVWTCAENPYFVGGRLTWLPARSAFEFTATGKDKQQFVFLGEFTQEPKLVPGEADDSLQQTFKLQLTDTTPAGARKKRQGKPGKGPRPLTPNAVHWRLVFNQQENNRLLVEVSRGFGLGRLRRIDTIGSQREGTSFAISDSDYGERTCVISQGLGTIPVSHNGKTYWVCCSGCQAAFEEDPEMWIARFEAIREKQKK